VSVAAHDREWTSTVRGLAAGALLAILSEGLCALFREREIMETINAYNYDLVKGNLAQ
jgi:hypothetical protein